MNQGKLVFSQLMAHLPRYEFNQCVRAYRGDYKVRKFTCWEQFLAMSFAQLTHRESLRDCVICLRTMQKKLYRMGFRSNISRSTLADANEKRNWRIYADFAQRLIPIARDLHRHDPLPVNLDSDLYALDSTMINLCVSLFPWAPFRSHTAAIKLHTLLDLKGNIPVFIHVSDGLYHDINALDLLVVQPGAYYVMDRGYLSFKRLYRIHCHYATFVTRPKADFVFRRLYSRPVDKSIGIRCDQIIRPVSFYPAKDYPEKLRRIKFYDSDKQRHLIFLTNNFNLSPIVITELYKSRWHIELFFKWIKQHLRIKAFFGVSENAVKSQIWIAVCTYLLVAIVRKRLNLELTLYNFLQILSISIFEKVDILQLVTNNDLQKNLTPDF